MTGVTIPLFMPWWAGAALMALGGLLFFIGHRQGRRDFDITRLPLTTATQKQFWGAALALLGASQAFGPLLQ